MLALLQRPPPAPPPAPPADACGCICIEDVKDDNDAADPLPGVAPGPAPTAPMLPLLLLPPPPPRQAAAVAIGRSNVDYDRRG